MISSNAAEILSDQITCFVNLEKLSKELRDCTGFSASSAYYRIAGLDNKDKVSKADLTTFCRKHGWPLNDREANAIMEQFDIDNNGLIDREEFTRFVKGQDGNYNTGARYSGYYTRYYAPSLWDYPFYYRSYLEFPYYSRYYSLLDYYKPSHYYTSPYYYGPLYDYVPTYSRYYSDYYPYRSSLYYDDLYAYRSYYDSPYYYSRPYYRSSLYYDDLYYTKRYYDYSPSYTVSTAYSTPVRYVSSYSPYSSTVTRTYYV